MGIASDLRESVLQAAIQGKLTTQKVEDGNARDLLREIRAEKEKLVKEKKIKKEKPLAPITEDEMPFDIPDNWVWCRLGEAITLVSGQDFSPHQYSDTSHEGLPYITGASNFGDNGIIENRWTKTPRCIVSRGDLLLICKGSGYGKVMICNLTLAHIARQIMGIRQSKNIDIRYVKCFLESNFDLLKKFGQGVIPGISRHDILTMQFPFPPLTEQHRIVARVDELMKEIDKLEKTEKELEAIKAAFPADMKAALLQAAMQGKLTKQLPEDGNARDLLAQIKAEKERLIKEKKIKKEKPLEPISEDEVPFDVPENWKWCYLGDIFNHNAGKALNARNTKGEKHKYITTSNVYWDHFELDNLKEMYYTPDEVEKYSVRKGDLLVLEGGDIGRTAIWDRDETYCVQNHVHRLRPYLKVDVKYFYYCMMYYKNNGMISGKGIAIQGLSANALHCINIPLPPLAEQHRIVEKIDQLLPLCDNLSKY